MKTAECGDHSYDTLTGLKAPFDKAKETMRICLVHLDARLMNEESSAEPIAAKLKALRTQIEIIKEERDNLSPDDHDLISKALYIYAPIMRAIYSSPQDY
jgi:hypothetical protein